MMQIGKQLYNTKKKRRVQKILEKERVANSKTHKYFLPHARLNRGQRRFCHCIMKARTSNPGKHYGFCQGLAKIDWAKAKTMRNKTKARQNFFKINKTNCVMNYDYNDYSLEDVRAFAAEKGIPLFEYDAKGMPVYYPKDRLVQLLVTNYIKKHTVLKEKKDQVSPVPPTFNFKPTRGGPENDVDAVALHRADDSMPVQTVYPEKKTKKRKLKQ